MSVISGTVLIHARALIQENNHEQAISDIMSYQSSQDQKDTAQFDKLGAQWWDQNGPMGPLHHFTPVRLKFILDMISRYHIADHIADKTPSESQPLSGLRILDIGCGGGLLAEPLARLGARITAIDASAPAIEAAKSHATNQGLEIDYRCCLSEELADDMERQDGAKFDVVYSSEVIEHVASRALFLDAIRRLVTNEGLVVITTINRTLASLATVKIGAEYITGHIPKGTHQFEKFVTPTELQDDCLSAGILLDHFTGFVPSVRGGFRTSSYMGVNYAAAGQLK